MMLVLRLLSVQMHICQNMLAMHMTKAIELARSVGYKEIQTFKQRKKNTHPLDNLMNDHI